MTATTAHNTDLELPLEGWYVAARAADVIDAPSECWVLGHPLVLYRTSGDVVALAGACPHRQYPLWHARRVGDEIECGYHGLRFSADGRCAGIPSQSHVPAGFRVRRYPAVQRGDWVWVWMGDPAGADVENIPDKWQHDPEWHSVSGLMQMHARPLLLIENLMDLSHETFVHGDSIGNREVAETPIETTVHGNTVRGARLIRGSAAPPFFVALGIVAPIERDQVVEFIPPSFVIVHSTVRDARGTTYQWKVLNAITPAKDGSLNYHWAVSRDFARSTDHDAVWLKGTPAVFEQDRRVLEAQEHMLHVECGDPELSVAADAPALQTRLALRRVCAQR